MTFRSDPPRSPYSIHYKNIGNDDWRFVILTEGGLLPARFHTHAQAEAWIEKHKHRPTKTARSKLNPPAPTWGITYDGNSMTEISRDELDALGLGLVRARLYLDSQQQQDGR